MARLPNPKAGNFQHFRSLGLVGPPRRAKRRYERISQRSGFPSCISYTTGQMPHGLYKRSARNIGMRHIIIMTAFFTTLGRLFGGEEKPPFEVAPIYRDMRNHALKVNDKELPDLKGKRVFAVLMESGFPEAAYTLVAAGDGGASLYFSNGGGLIGAGEHANVRPESLWVVGIAEGCLKHMKKVDQFPIVKPGNTTFYVVTSEGVFTYSAREDDLGERRDKNLSDLFHQSHVLITQMRIADEKQKAEPGAAATKPADKAPAEVQPPTPTEKDVPR